MVGVLFLSYIASINAEQVLLCLKILSTAIRCVFVFSKCDESVNPQKAALQPQIENKI